MITLAMQHDVLICPFAIRIDKSLKQGYKSCNTNIGIALIRIHYAASPDMAYVHKSPNPNSPKP